MTSNHVSGRIVEAYIGEYASGKSEMAINRALELKNIGRKTTLVDLDTVEPFYTLRPIKELLEKEGLNVISFTRADSFGLGETGAMLNPRSRWALRHEGDVIMDVGYGVHGASTLNLVEGAYESNELKIIAVINYMRPMTSSKDRINDYLTSLGRIDGIVANNHLGGQTTLQIIEDGYQEIYEICQEIEIPLEYVAINIELKAQITEEKFDVPVKYIKRYMPTAMW